MSAEAFRGALQSNSNDIQYRKPTYRYAALSWRKLERIQTSPMVSSHHLLAATFCVTPHLVGVCAARKRHVRVPRKTDRNLSPQIPLSLHPIRRAANRRYTNGDATLRPRLQIAPDYAFRPCTNDMCFFLFYSSTIPSRISSI